ncbi:helix-turn-helix domain-containing protein [Spirosoma validum]|uniref:AraC family transcriptional regulator n=1 Tax=Spirosoma validum TaxID=2771355 RepID=A0A927B232_9BACT|nr:helix-turn-helix domain-containing protein [Spirosoma validum]MBD2754159.1 AraC family transcriptional regulator [Spirosoma validum]
MKYEKIPPPAHLDRYVQYFWTYESEGMAGPPKTFRPITDGCPGIIVQLSERDPLFDQNKKQLPTLCLYGQTIKHREIQARDQFRVIGACFSPVGLKSIFGLNADELTDTCAALNGLPGQQALFLSEQLAGTDSIRYRIELLSAYVSAQIRENKFQLDNVTDYALSQLIKSEGTIPLKELQDELNVSERHLERKFKEGVGISPKLFSRICRFQASFQQLKTNKYDKLSDIAFENGYADQSHFIRVFKEFAGFPPNRYGKQSAEIVENLAEWY